MKKINFSIEENQQIIKRREEMKKVVLANPSIQNLLRSNNLTDNAVDEYLSKIYGCIESVKICKECKSIDNCPYHPKGYRPKIRLIDKRIIVENQQCSKSKQQNSKENTSNLFVWDNRHKNNLDLTFKQLLNQNISDISISELRFREKIKNWFEDNQTGLYLYGEPGVGKSDYLCALANEYVSQGKYVAYINVPTYSLNFQNFFIDNETLNEYNRMLALADVIILENLGIESVTAIWRDAIMVSLVETLKANQKKLILSSPLNLDQLKEHYEYSINRNYDVNRANLIASRIKQNTTFIELVR